MFANNYFKLPFTQDVAEVMSFKLETPATEAVPTPPAINVTGFTGRLRVRRHIKDQKVLATLTTENGGIIINGNEITLRLPVEVQELMFSGVETKVVYDLYIFSPSGAPSRILFGDAILIRAVSRNA